MIVSSSWPLFVIIDTSCCCSSVSGVSASRRPTPSTAFIGVRISCDWRVMDAMAIKGKCKARRVRWTVRWLAPIAAASRLPQHSPPCPSVHSAPCDWWMLRRDHIR